MVMLIVGLAGLGIGVSGGLAPQSIARVGDRPVSSRRLRPRPAAGAARLLPAARPRAADGRGPRLRHRPRGARPADQRRRPRRRGRDASASPPATSAVRAQLMATPAFQGADGKFSRDAYTYALERIGMKPAEFEELLRSEAARELVAGGVQAAVRMPETAARTVLDFLGEKRGFDWIRLDAAPAARAGRRADRRRARGRARRPPRPLHPARDPPHHLPRASPPTRWPRPSRSPRTSCAPPTTPTSRATRPPSAASPTASASPTPRRPPRPGPGSTPARSTSTPSPPSAA